MYTSVLTSVNIWQTGSFFLCKWHFLLLGNIILFYTSRKSIMLNGNNYYYRNVVVRFQEWTLTIINMKTLKDVARASILNMFSSGTKQHCQVVNIKKASPWHWFMEFSHRTYRVQTSQSVLNVQCSHSVTPSQVAIARPWHDGWENIWSTQ